jgi:hypothetical protein
MVCIGFWHITLFSQPRSFPPDIAGGLGTFLPALFVCYAFWRLAIRFVLPAFAKMPIEAMILYLGPYWVTVLANLTTERIPINRLTAADITAQRNGLAALIVIVIVLFVLVINQVRVIHKTGWLPYYLGWYILGGLVTLVLALLPTLNLRLHHYIIAIILMPGTAFPTRLSALYQGFLLGLFLNGTAAFGFASMFQTSAQVISPLSRVIIGANVLAVAATRWCIRHPTPEFCYQFHESQFFLTSPGPDDILVPPSEWGRLGWIRPASGRRGALCWDRAQLFSGSIAERTATLFQASGMRFVHNAFDLYLEFHFGSSLVKA